MPTLSCNHCSGQVAEGEKKCPHCGIPLPPDFGQESQKRFKVFFVLLIVFCAVMIYWLPPDWSFLPK